MYKYYFMKKIYFIPIAGAFSFFGSQSLRAQNKLPFEKYFSYGFNFSPFGIGFSNHLSGTGDQAYRNAGFAFHDNGRGGIISAGVKSFGVNTAFMWKDKRKDNFTTVGVEFQQNRQTYCFDLPLSYTYTSTHDVRGGDNDADDPVIGQKTDTLTHKNKWADMDRYLKYSVFVQRSWYTGPGLFEDGKAFAFIKLSYGQTFLHRNQGHIIKEGTQEIAEDGHGNTVIARTLSSNSTSFLFGFEIGARNMSGDKTRCLDYGLSLNIPLAPTCVMDYQMYNAQLPSQVGNSQHKFGGGSVMFNITYNFNSRIKDRIRDTILIEETKKETPIVHVHKPHHLNGRKVHVAESIIVRAGDLTVNLWDKGKIDGDRVSLFLNGEEILGDYEVGKTRNNVELHLKEGPNYLIMHALNLGRVPPNTAAIEFYSGGKKKRMVINSDMKKSGAIEIIYKPIE
jgi:hypothetical protein